MTACLAAQGPSFTLAIHVHQDKTLRPPNGLTPDEVDVRIDGKSRPVRSLGPAGPFSVLLLVDASASMSRAAPSTQLAQAVTSLLAQLRPGEQLRVAVFNAAFEMGPDFGSAPASIAGFLRGVSYRGGTRLYDALDTGLLSLERVPGHRALVVLSDGSDTDSRRTGDDVRTHALQSGVQVWALLPREELRGVKGRGPDKALLRIVEDTGGVSVHQAGADLASSISDAMTYLREQYAVEVDAAAVDQKVHRVAVRVKPSGLILRAPRAVALRVPCADCTVLTSGSVQAGAPAATNASAQPGTPAAPTLVSPPEGAVLTFFPRLIDFEWTPVPSAAGYRIEIDCYHCCRTDAWCSDVNPGAVQARDVTVPKATIEFPGNQPGRWRVSAIDARGRSGAKTAWRQFNFYRPAVPSVAPPSFRDPATGGMISGPGVVGPKAVYSPSPPYPPSAQKDRLTGEVIMEAVVDESGRVQSVRVTRSARADLDDSAVATLRTWRFEPAQQNGRAVPARIDITMTFNLK